MNNAAIVLTKNEEIHIERCIRNIFPLFKKIYIVDSLSTDKTKELAKKWPIEFLENPFINQATQFNWALKQIDQNTNWVLRIDADEYLSQSLINEISLKLDSLDSSIKGIFLPRRIIFQDKMLNHGAVNRTKILRLFKFGYGESDDRWMDEHIVVNGKTINFRNSLIDHNLKPISWWINKHNNYANREVFEIIKNELNPKRKKNEKYYFSQENRKRYYSQPPILRAIFYFIYRYIFCLGFLDGKNGFCFHILQGFWYRLIIDMKYLELKSKLKQNKISRRDVIRNFLSIDFVNEDAFK